jgi:hypothetical protein
VGKWVCPGSNEQRDDAVAALADRGVVLLGDGTQSQAADDCLRRRANATDSSGKTYAPPLIFYQARSFDHRNLLLNVASHSRKEHSEN